MQVLCKCYASAMQVLCKCYASTMQVPWKCYASDMPVPCKCHASAMQLQCKCTNGWKIQKKGDTKWEKDKQMKILQKLSIIRGDTNSNNATNRWKIQKKGDKKWEKDKKMKLVILRSPSRALLGLKKVCTICLFKYILNRVECTVLALPRGLLIRKSVRHQSWK